LLAGKFVENQLVDGKEAGCQKVVSCNFGTIDGRTEGPNPIHKVCGVDGTGKSRSKGK